MRSSTFKFCMLFAGVTLIACIYVVINLIVDLTYGMLDPRIRIAR